MAPIPIALCGKSLTMAQSFSDAMLPEYEIIHVFQNPAAVHHELPLLLNGESIKPQSGVGSNADSEDTKLPKAVFVGAGWSRNELADIMSVKGAENLPFLYPNALKTAASVLTGPMLLTVIVKRAKSCLKSNGLEQGKDVEIKPGVWEF